MPSQVLVTGGTGFIAGWCIAELLDRGYAARATVRDPRKEAAVRTAVATATRATDRLNCVVADLTSDDGWAAAMDGCDYVLHVASPLGTASSDRAALIEAARGGTLRVLRAATRAGVKRVVFTSAAAAARPPLDSGRESDETVWADPGDPQFDAYRVSKILAEKAAWEFIGQAGGKTSLTTILPGAVFGPVLTSESLGSVAIIQRLLDGKPPALPRLGFSVVDVRDLAALHVSAMTADQAAGERFLAAGDFVWMEDIANVLRSRLGARAGRVPARRMPDLVMRAASLVQPDLRAMTPLLGRRYAVDASKARTMLGFAPRPGADTVVDCAESLLARG